MLVSGPAHSGRWQGLARCANTSPARFSVVALPLEVLPQVQPFDIALTNELREIEMDYEMAERV